LTAVGIEDALDDAIVMTPMVILLVACGLETSSSQRGDNSGITKIRTTINISINDAG